MCKIIDYSEKSFALVGDDTKLMKNELRKLGGRYNPNLTCGKGWIFSNKSREGVNAYLSNGMIYITLGDKVMQDNEEPKAAKKQAKQAKKQNGIPYCYDELCEAVDAKERDMDTYYKKYWLPFKLQDGRIFAIQKPQIETEFWYGENGGDSYDNARNNCQVMTSSETAFINENLRAINHNIKVVSNPDSNAALRCWGSHPKVLELGDKRQENAILFTDETRQYIVAILNQEKAKFEKRLHSYLKRYGLSKVSARTYWTER